MNNKLVHRPSPHPPTKNPPMSMGPSFRFQNLRLDPARVLEPARKKLTTLETQRVMSVFEETIRRCEIVTLLPYIMRNVDRFRVSLGGELVKLLKHHSVIISSYDDIRQELDNQLKRRSAMQKSPVPTPSEGGEKEEGGEELDKDLSRQGSTASVRSTHSNDSQMEATMMNLSLVAQQMSHSTRNILRAFTLNPAIMTVVQGEMSQRGPECKALLQYMQDLKEILMHKMLTTPEEERERMAYLTQISKRGRLNAVNITKLEEDLKEKNDDKDEEVRKKNDVIKRLQSELHATEKFSDENIRRVRADAEKQEAADEKNSDGKRQMMMSEIAKLKSQLQNATTEHRDTEQVLRRNKFKIETEVENWIQRYDQELRERHDQIEQIDAVYTEEKKQLHEVKEPFDILAKEYVGIMKEKRLAREKHEKAERELVMTVKAAATIQAFWRSYRARKVLAARKKKGGKAKEKGGEKGDKKGGKKGGKKGRAK